MHKAIDHQRELTTVPFRGAELVAIAGNTPAVTLVAIKPISKELGLDWSSQLQRIKRTEVLRTSMVTLTIQLPGDRQARKHVFLPLNRINLWLATVDSDLVEDAAVKAKVIDYQTECADVLFDHFFAKAIGAPTAGGGISREARQEIGGVAKSVVNKALEPVKHDVGIVKRDVAEVKEGQSRLAADVAKIMSIVGPTDRTRVTVTSHRPMLDILIGAGVTDKHGRRPLVTQCTKSLLRWLEGKEFSTPFFKERSYLFNIRAAAAWLEEQGKAIVAEHKINLASVAGQPELDFGRPRRRKRIITDPAGATA